MPDVIYRVMVTISLYSFIMWFYVNTIAYQLYIHYCIFVYNGNIFLFLHVLWWPGNSSLKYEINYSSDFYFYYTYVHFFSIIRYNISQDFSFKSRNYQNDKWIRNNCTHVWTHYCCSSRHRAAGNLVLSYIKEDWGAIIFHAR